MQILFKIKMHQGSKVLVPVVFEELPDTALSAERYFISIEQAYNYDRGFDAACVIMDAGGVVSVMEQVEKEGETDEADDV